MSFGDDNDPPITDPPSHNDDDNNDYEPYGLGAIYLHRWIDCQDEYNKWYEAQILDIDPTNNKRIKVHYKGWISKFDTWVDLNLEPERARILHTFTPKPVSLGSVNLQIGTKCDCLDSTDKWYKGSIVDINKYLIKIHYRGWDHKYDEWINKDSYRIAPLNTMTSGVITPSTPSNNNTVTSPPSSSPSGTTTTKPRRRSNSGNGTIKRKAFKRNLSNDNITNIPIADINIDNKIDNNVIQPVPVLVPATTDIKADNDDDNNDNDDDITQEQREKNEKIRRNYISNFKPTALQEEQFSDKLNKKGFRIISMGEDGNCLFRSISHQMYGTEDYHQLLRAKCVSYLRVEREYFSSYVDGGQDINKFNEYCNRMSHDGIWGDNVEIQAFSEIYNRPIEIYAYMDTPRYIFNNSSANANADNNNTSNPLRLSYHCNSHYNSIIDPLIHYNSSYLLDINNVGKLEDEKIELSKLRSIHANQQTLILSDIQQTELQQLRGVLSLSRKQFHNINNNNNIASLDCAIKESLKQFEIDSLENAKLISIREKEKKEKQDLELAIKQSIVDISSAATAQQNNDDNDDNNQLNIDNDYNVYDNNNKDILMIDNDIIKTVIDRGYTTEQATLAWSVYEYQKDQINKNDLVNKMIEYINQMMFSDGFFQ